MTTAVHNSFRIKNKLVTGLFFVMLLFVGGCSELSADATMQAGWISSVQNCWPCILYKSAFNAIDGLILQLYPTMTEKGLVYMGASLLLWLAFTTGKFVTTLYEPDTKKYILSVMTVLFKAMLVGVVLSQGERLICFIDLVVSPVLTFFTQLSRIAISSNTNINSGLIWPNEFKDAPEQICAVFSPQVKYQLQDIIYRVYVALNGGISLGVNFMLQMNVVNWILGPIIIWTFFIMMMLFPWIFVDSFIRLGSVLILSPFFLVAWVFPETKGKVKEAWNVIFGAAMQILIACIYIGLIVGVIRAFEAQNWPGMLGTSRQTADPGILIQFRRMSIEAVSFFALLIIMIKMQGSIPAISGALGGDSQKSQMIGFMDGVKQLAISTAMLAIGALMMAFGIPGGDRLVKRGAERMAKQAKDVANDTMNEISNSGEGTPGDGGSDGLASTLNSFIGGDGGGKEGGK